MSSEQNQEATPSNNRDSSHNERLYTTATPIRFAPRSTRNTIIDSNVVMLDPRNVQQWQLDAVEARIDEFNDILHDEVETLRDELDDIKLSRQRTAQSGCFPWKSIIFIIVVAGIVAVYSGNYNQQALLDLVDYSRYV